MANRWIAAVVAAGVLFGGCASTSNKQGAAQPSPIIVPSSSNVNGANGAPATSSYSEEQISQAPDGAAPPSSNVGQNSNYGYTVEQYLNFVVDELDQVWSQWFIKAGYAEPMVGYQIVEPGKTFTSKCTDTNQQPLKVGHDFPNAFYCPRDSIVGSDGRTYDGMVILPVTTFQKMWTGDVFERQSKQVGDFAAATIVAHEFGHHVQDELMTQFNARQGQQAKAPTGANKELIADCFAGVWMTAEYYRGVLTDTDVEEAVAALEAIGDGPGVSADPHGTSAQRAAALRLGYHGGDGYAPGKPAACINAYWK